jgi:hypothetical protein
MLVVLTGLLAGCFPDAAPRSENEAQLDLKLTLSPTLTIDSVEYEVSGNGIVPLTGTIDLTMTSDPSLMITGIPANSNPYTVTMTAMANPPSQITCTASAPFTVVDGQAAMVDLVLQCTRPRVVTGLGDAGT